LAAAFSLILVAIAATYYFVIALPKIQTQKIEFEKDKYQTDKYLEDQKNTAEEIKKNQTKKELDSCLDDALSAYHDNWENDCKIQKTVVDENYKKCVDSRNNSYNSCKVTGLSEEYCKSIWLDNRDSYCKTGNEYKEDENGSCLLPNVKSERIESVFKEQKDECYKKFELNK
jgi:hypothetical protein